MNRSSELPWTKEPKDRWPDCADRSQLLRAGVLRPARRRPYALRRIIVLPFVALLALFIWIFGWQILPITSVTYPIYWLHDALWLPFWAIVSTWLFPWSFVWLVPTAGLLYLAGLEYLTPLRPLRRLQIRALTALAQHGSGARLILNANTALRRFGLRAGLARDVVGGLAERARDAAFREAPQDPRQLFNLLSLSLRLGTGSIDEQFAAAEQLLLQPAEKGPETARRQLVSVLGRQSAGRIDWQGLLDLAQDLPPDMATEIAGQARRLHHLVADPPEAALLILRAACLASATADRRSLMPFQAWAQLSATAGPETVARLAEAASLIRFEYWAAATERRIASAASPTPKGVVDMALPGALGLAEQGERFASGEGRR